MHQDKYHCATQDHPSETRILILSLNDKYLSLEFLQNITSRVLPENSEKSRSYPIIFSGFVKNSQNCVSFIELPELYDNLEILTAMEYLKTKCFDRSSLIIDARLTRPTEEKIILMVSLLQLMDLAYGPKFFKTLSVVVLIRRKSTIRIKKQSENFVQNIFKKILPDDNGQIVTPKVSFHRTQWTK